MKALHLLALGSVLSASLVFAQSTATPPAKTAPATTKPAAKTTAPKTPPPSASDIADAKAKGLVWFNNNTKVYHKSTDKEYGTTKNGKFLTEDAAKAAGGKLAKS